MAESNVLQRDTVYFYTLYTVQSLYLITFTWAKKSNQYFYQNICTSAWVVGTFATSGNKMIWLDTTW